MDHLPYPENAMYPPIRIPYLAPRAPEVYHGVNFDAFPVEAGWTEGKSDWFQCEATIAAARAQSWLFFGLLKEVIGPEFSEYSFIASNNEHGQFVSTKIVLPILLGNQFCSHEPLKFALRYRVFHAAKKQLYKYRNAMIKVEEEIRSIEYAFPDCNDIDLVCLSIRALLWSLRNAIVNQDCTISTRTVLELSSSRYLRTLLTQRGMCPHYLATIEERCSVVLLHYLAGLHRPIGQHSHCTRQLCCANIMDPLNYKTKHIDDECECDHIGPDIDQVSRAIDDGQIPVIRVSLRGASVRIDTQRASFDDPYTAISHVWSGGLGNQRASSLPACQLRRIHGLVRPLTASQTSVRAKMWRQLIKLSPSKHEDTELHAGLPAVTESCLIWMDTLCIPKQQPQRNTAINQMTRIYAGAQQVVVLDSGMRKVGIDTHGEEVLANLMSSAWMSRCWTFQEGRLAQQLLINIGPSLRHPFLIYDEVARTANLLEPGMGVWNDTVQLRRELASGLYTMRPMKDERIRSTDFENFADIWNELVKRTTSWPEDEIKILTLMLDLSVEEVESISGDDLRLKAVFKSQGDLPIAFLYAETSSSTDSIDAGFLERKRGIFQRSLRLPSLRFWSAGQAFK
ncbi:MAG: hypothetical protein Q9168_002916 [Polycauliona sp. 1 TL-2023]